MREDESEGCPVEYSFQVDIPIQANNPEETIFIDEELIPENTDLTFHEEGTILPRRSDRQRRPVTRYGIDEYITT